MIQCVTIITYHMTVKCEQKHKSAEGSLYFWFAWRVLILAATISMSTSIHFLSVLCYRKKQEHK